MHKTPRAYHAVHAFAGWLNQRKGEIDTNLKTLVPEEKGVTILPYWTANVDNGMYPVIMIEQTSKERTWEALDTGSGPTANLRLNLMIWGLVTGHEDSLLDDLIDELESSVAEIINSRHQTFTSEGWQFYFNETMPMPSSTFGAAKFSGALTRGFTSPIYVDAIFSVPQTPGTP